MYYVWLTRFSGPSLIHQRWVLLYYNNRTIFDLTVVEILCMSISFYMWELYILSSLKDACSMCYRYDIMFINCLKWSQGRMLCLKFLVKSKADGDSKVTWSVTPARAICHAGNSECREEEGWPLSWRACLLAWTRCSLGEIQPRLREERLETSTQNSSESLKWVLWALGALEVGSWLLPETAQRPGVARWQSKSRGQRERLAGFQALLRRGRHDLVHRLNRCQGRWQDWVILKSITLVAQW